MNTAFPMPFCMSRRPFVERIFAPNDVLRVVDICNGTGTLEFNTTKFETSRARAKPPASS